MFENFPEPWKGTDKSVSIVFEQIETKVSLIGGNGSFVHDSLIFNKNTLTYKLELVPRKQAKYRRTVTFPLKYIKFYEIREFIDYKDDLPRSYQVVFYVDMQIWENTLDS
jgi:hypothetical protein